MLNRNETIDDMLGVAGQRFKKIKEYTTMIEKTISDSQVSYRVVDTNVTVEINLGHHAVDDKVNQYVNFFKNDGAIVVKSDVRINNKTISVTFPKDDIDAIDIQRHKFLLEKNTYHLDYFIDVFKKIQSIFPQGYLSYKITRYVAKGKKVVEKIDIKCIDNEGFIDLLTKILSDMSISLRQVKSIFEDTPSYSLAFKEEPNILSLSTVYSSFFNYSFSPSIMTAINKMAHDVDFYKSLLRFIKSKPNVILFNYLLSIAKNENLFTDEQYISLVLAGLEASFLNIENIKVGFVENNKTVYHELKTITNQLDPGIWMTLRESLKKRSDFQSEANMSAAIKKYIENINSENLILEEKYIKLARLAKFLELCINNPKLMPFFNNRGSSEFKSTLTALRETGYALIKDKFDSLKNNNNAYEISHLLELIDDAIKQPLFYLHANNYMFSFQCTNTIDKLNLFKNELNKRTLKGISDIEMIHMYNKAMKDKLFEKFKKENTKENFLMALLMHYIVHASPDSATFPENQKTFMEEQYIGKYINLPDIKKLTSFLQKNVVGKHMVVEKNKLKDHHLLFNSLELSNFRYPNPLDSLRSLLFAILDQNDAYLNKNESDVICSTLIAVIDQIKMINEKELQGTKAFLDSSRMEVN